MHRRINDGFLQRHAHDRPLRQTVGQRLVAPDQHIQNIKLSRDLEPGEYAAVATFTGYDRETHKKTGQAAAEITLRVEG